ncbi:MAG: hypothetical protein H6Q59_2204 [Firmicutes bacterium]|nr:hypothetical protein [Bacillota bacterium]
MELLKKLNKHGIDTESVITRLGGNVPLYLSICKKFLFDTSYPKLMEALSLGSISDAKMHIHTLKGVAANLGFQYMHALCKHILTAMEQCELKCFEHDINCLSDEYKIIIAILSDNGPGQKLNSSN